MITKLIIRNFKAIESLDVPLRPFTVLVGPNDAGKSTILQALEILSRSVSGVMESGTPLIFDEPIERYLPSGDRSRPIHLEVHGVWRFGGEDVLVAPRTYEYVLEFNGPPARIVQEVLVVDGNDQIRQSSLATRSAFSERSPIGSPLADLRAELSSFLVRFDPRRLASPAKLGAVLEPDGSGLAAVIDELLTAADKQPGLELQHQLNRFSRNVSDSGLSTPPSADRQGKQLFFSLAGNKQPVSAGQMSDGVLLATAFLALRYGTPFRRYLVEEPENGIHPRVAAMIVRLLRELTTSGDRQVIATTHSPLLLNHVAPEDVLVVTRSTAGVKVTPLTETNSFDERIKDFDVGELWYNVGESELVRDAK